MTEASEIVPNFPFLNALADGPDSQIDAQMGDMIRGLDSKSLDEVKSAVHKALDFGARYALASTFTMMALNIEWKRIGGKDDDPTPWREEIEKNEGYGQITDTIVE